MERYAIVPGIKDRVKVYKHSEKLGIWVNSNDCTTEYKDSDIVLLEEVK